ncbi:MAG TPA: RNA polymerase sigma factor [Vicinamibacterales bacterium]
MADKVSSRAGDMKQAAPGAANALTSLELLARAKGGDELALNDLCARYLPRLRKWAHGRLPAYARGALDTYDIVQETLAKAVRGLDSFEPRHSGSFQGFLHTTLRNCICDQVRSARRRPTSMLDSDRAADDPTPFELAVGQETADRYEAALERLKPADREAIVARIELGLPYAEVAAALRKPSIAAAHVAVSRALVKLAKEMSSGRRS